MHNTNVNQLFNKYYQQYPLYKRETIIDLMLKDGVNSNDIAKKLKNGKSCFCFISENELAKSDTTEIFGGFFSKKTPETNYNKKIEPTFQSEKQGDCWLLSDINAMNQTEWGKKAISDAIEPLKDGSVLIKFKGSPLEKKDFLITSDEIHSAKQSGYYSKGDDDMIAFELATEKLAKLLEKKGVGKRITLFDEIAGYNTYISGGGIYDKDGNSLDISTLITGKKDVYLSFTEIEKVPTSILKIISDNKESYAPVCTFLSDYTIERPEDDLIHGNHAYAIKDFKYGEKVILIDPFHAGEQIELPWKKFINEVTNIRISAKDNEAFDKLDNLIPTNLKQKFIESFKKSAEINNETEQRKIDVDICEKIFPEVVKILIGFNIQKENINFSVINNLIKTEFLKNNDFELFYNSIRMEISFEERKETTKNVNKDNVVLLLQIYPNFINHLDSLKSGWGKGKEKKELISPVINALVEKAREKNIPNEIINNFSEKCMKELNAIIYTNEAVINNEVEKMLNLLKEN